MVSRFMLATTRLSSGGLFLGGFEGAANRNDENASNNS
jgi:hypothetical protein